jgi:competence protein ComEC
VKQAAAYPFLRILLPLLAGMISGMAAGDLLLLPRWQLLIFLLSVVFLIGLLAFRNHRIGSWFAVLTLFTVGTGIWRITDQRNKDNHYSHLPKKGIWKVELLEDAEGTGKFRAAMGKLQTYTDSSGKTIPAIGRLRILFRGKEGIQAICGNTYYINGQLSEPNGPQIPDAFDYREYLRRKQVYAQLRADSGDYRFLGRNTGIRTLAADFARAIEAKIGVLPEQNRAALLISLITGDKRGVTEEDRQHFAQTGTLHVLAVSGLHVGIVYGILLFLSGRFFRRNHPAQALIILLFVWAYALISGLAPSVFRAAFMFSLLTLGQVWSRSSKGLNTLAATAVCMLCIEPRWLQDIGFLLSYSAVGGIMLFYQRIEKAWQPRSIALLYIWKMSAVSIAAQLGTLPVTLYCFNSFPLWFLPANLLVIPISTLCLVSGLGFLLISDLPWAGDALGWITDRLLWLLQFVVGKLASLPMQSIDHLYPNGAAIAALAFLILLLAAGPLLPVRYRLAGLALGLLGLSAAESRRQWDNRFSEPERYAMRWQQGTAVVSASMGEAVLMTQNLRKGQTDTLRRGLEKWLRRKGIKKVAMSDAVSSGSAGMIVGRSFRLTNGSNLYLERLSVHFNPEKSVRGVFVRRRNDSAGNRRKFSDSIKLLKNLSLTTLHPTNAQRLTDIGPEWIRVPTNGFVRL